MSEVDLRVNIGRLELANPVMTASGTFGGSGQEFAPFFDLSVLGAIVGKTITPHPRKGNPPPRTHETPGGLLNSIGLMNPGFPGWVEEVLPELRKSGTKVVINVAGETEAQYYELAEKLDDLCGVDAVEVNISCPNVEQGGACPAQDPAITSRVLTGVLERTNLPIIAKLTPNVADITVIARAAEDAGAHAVSLVNTYLGTAVDWRKRSFVFANKVAGLSGPAIRPMALLCVWRTAQAVSIPVVGIGGIGTAEHAMEFLAAGATAIQVGTASFVSPTAAARVVEELPGLLAEAGVSSVREFHESMGGSLGT
ncbi:MAG: dihydroorotate dehydrogenase [Planctomycetota bacterium]